MALCEGTFSYLGGRQQTAEGGACEVRRQKQRLSCKVLGSVIDRSLVLPAADAAGQVRDSSAAPAHFRSLLLREIAAVWIGAVGDSRQALSGHQLHDGPCLTKSKKLSQDEPLLFGGDHQPAVQHLPTGKLDRRSR